MKNFQTSSLLIALLATGLFAPCAHAEDSPPAMSPPAPIVGTVVSAVTPPPEGGAGVQPQPAFSPGSANHVDAYKDLTPQERDFLLNLSSLERETIMMQAKVKLLEEKSKYEEISRKIQQGLDERATPKMPEKAMDSASNPVSSAYDAHIAPDEKALAEMTLVSVYGTTSLEGELFYRGGRMKVVKGARLPGDWVVSSIEPTRLIASKGARRFEVVIGSPQTGSTSSVNKIR